MQNEEDYSEEQDKLADAMHYLCWLSNELGRTLDEVQLNKVLWYSDSLSYMTKGQPIIGTPFMRKPRGPVAKRHSKIVSELIENRRLAEGFAPNVKHGGYLRVLDSIREPYIDDFSEREIDIFKLVHQYVTTEVSTKEISDQSHGEIWNLARENEIIPLYTIFAEQLGTIRPEEIADAKAAN